MEISKEQIIKGVTDYAKKELIDKIDDKSLKRVIGLSVSVLTVKPQILNEYLENGVISSLVSTENGKIDLDLIFSVLIENVREYGAFEFVIPSIPLLSKYEFTLKFTDADIKKLKTYIEGGEEE